MKPYLISILALLLFGSSHSCHGFQNGYPQKRAALPIKQRPCHLMQHFHRHGSKSLTVRATAEIADTPTALANSTSTTLAGFSLRAMAFGIIASTLLRKNNNMCTLSTAVRLSTAAIAHVDFAPMMDGQWSNVTPATNSKTTESAAQIQKFSSLVRLKLAGELLGLAILLLSSRLPTACAGALVILLSHTLFWILGGGECKANADGSLAPIQPELVRVICTADVILALLVLMGALAPSSSLGKLGAGLYSSLVTVLVAGKLKKRISGWRKQSGANNINGGNAANVKGKHVVEFVEVGPSKARNDLVDNDLTRVGNEDSASGDAWNYNWRNQWYALAFEKVTDKAIPHRLELFGEHLVLWHNGAAWSALADSCPHRMTPLSEGRIDEEGQIECPYHGWTFTGQGECTKIPQAPVTNESSSGGGGGLALGGCSARSYQVVEKQGIIFVWGQMGGKGDESLVPTCRALDDDRFVWIDFSRDLPYSSDSLLENVADSSHICFTHDSTASKRENASPLPLRLTSEITPLGFEGEHAFDVPIGMVAVENIKNKRVTRRSIEYVAPSYMNDIIQSANVEDMDFDNGFETWTVAYATPAGPGRCRLLSRFPFRFPPPKRRFLPNIPRLILKRLPDWLNHMKFLQVTDDDSILLSIQERVVQDAGGWKRNYKQQTDSDVFVTAYRKWYDRAGPPPHSPYAVDNFRFSNPRKEELLDRKSQHTDHCASCQGAQKNARRIRNMAQLLLVACAAAFPALLVQKSYKYFAGLVVAAGVLLLGGKTASVVETSLVTGMNDYPPLRNRRNGKIRELRTVHHGRTGL